MNTQLAQLRSLVAARFPAAMQASFLGSSITVNETVKLRPGKLVEIVSSDQSAGAGLLMLHLAQQTQGPLAWVDAADGLDLASLPLELRQRVLWLRAQGMKDSLKATDMLLRDGNLQTVFLDLRLVPERQLHGLPSSIWHRLRMLAEKAHVSVVVFSPLQMVGCAAARWSVKGRFDLNSLQQERDVLRHALHTIPQRGAGSVVPDAEPEELSLPS